MAEAAPPDALGGGLVTVDEAAAFLGVKPGTVYLWAETGRIPSYKIGNRRRFRLSDLEAYVQGQRTGGQAAPKLKASPNVTGRS